MQKAHREQLVHNRVSLIRQLPLESVLLRMGSIFTDQHREDILAEKTTQDKVRSFLDILASRGPRAFDVFCTALNAVGCRHLLKPTQIETICYTWKYIRSDDKTVIIEDHRRYFTEKAARKEGLHCKPSFTTWDGPDSPSADLIITQGSAVIVLDE